VASKELGEFDSKLLIDDRHRHSRQQTPAACARESARFTASM